MMELGALLGALIFTLVLVLGIIAIKQEGAQPDWAAHLIGISLLLGPPLGALWGWGIAAAIHWVAGWHLF